MRQCADCGKACEAYRCDECRKARQRERWAKRYNDPRFKDKERERSRLKMAKWRKSHAEHYQESRRKYYAKNREKILAYLKEYHARKKEEKQIK